jgi:hypothetical protein
MDMWLLLINICLMISIIYFGRKMVNTLTRIINVGEQRENNQERQRCIKIVEAELEHYRVVNDMHADAETNQVIHTLEYVLDNIKRK